MDATSHSNHPSIHPSIHLKFESRNNEHSNECNLDERTSSGIIQVLVTLILRDRRSCCR